MTKRVLAAVLLTISMPIYADLEDEVINFVSDYGKDIVGKSVAELSKMSDGLNDALAVCYIKESSKSVADLDICGYIEKTNKILSIDICEEAPEVEGYKKKKNTLSSNDKRIKDFCEKNINERAKSVIMDADIFSRENNLDFTDDNNTNEEKSGEFFAKGGSPAEIVKNHESISRQALYSGNQKVMKEVVNYAKNKNGSMSEVKTQDISAPSNYTDYLIQRKTLVQETFADYDSQSPYSVSSAIRNDVQDVDDPVEALNKANAMSANETDKIRFGTNKRIQLYLDVLAKDDDYAIPTQEMVNLLREDLRPEAVAKIKQQLKREALIISELMQIDQARKDLLTIAATKAVVISRKFDAQTTQSEIDKLIDDGGGIGDVIGTSSSPFANIPQIR